MILAGWYFSISNLIFFLWMSIMLAFFNYEGKIQINSEFLGSWYYKSLSSLFKMFFSDLNFTMPYKVFAEQYSDKKTTCLFQSKIIYLIIYLVDIWMFLMPTWQVLAKFIPYHYLFCNGFFLIAFSENSGFTVFQSFLLFLTTLLPILAK